MNESAASWLQKNSFIIAAVGLPGIVVMFFLAATIIPEWTVDDPRHDVVFAQTRHEYRSVDITVEYRVENGRLMAVARRLPENGYGIHQRLYHYHTRDERLEELQVDVPEDVRRNLMAEPVIAGQTPPSETFDPGLLGDIPLSTRAAAPDGYEFVHRNSVHRGLFGELFGMGRRQTRLGLGKHGRLVPIEAPESENWRPYNGAVFLGWVEDSQ